jgi:hypothetical protein
VLGLGQPPRLQVPPGVGKRALDSEVSTRTAPSRSPTRWDIQNDSARSGPGAGSLGAHVRLRLGDPDYTVVVTMATMRMEEVAADQIIHVVGMGYHVVPTA